MRLGRVYLVGAGPGDPGLLTVRGREVLGRAEVVIYDRLVNPALLAQAPPEALRIFAGKLSGERPISISQSEINRLLLTHARRGRLVVRLKGGDPFVFGRGGEEAEALAEAGIPFEVVPGVSAAIAVPAYAGIPVTHRDYASSVTIVTGREGAQGAPGINWEALAALGGTLVVLMGVAALPDFTQRLMAGGLDPATPAAVIQEGTTRRQRSVAGTLADIAARAADAGLTAPATTVIGQVVAMGNVLAWYNSVVSSLHC